MKKGSRRRKRARVPGRARRGSTKGRRNIISFSATPETKLGRWKEVCVCACVYAAWAKNLPLKSTPAAIRRPRDDNGRRVEKCP